jgi:hypothetical protein
VRKTAKGKQASIYNCLYNANKDVNNVIHEDVYKRLYCSGSNMHGFETFILICGAMQCSVIIFLYFVFLIFLCGWHLNQRTTYNFDKIRSTLFSRITTIGHIIDFAIANGSASDSTTCCIR